MTLSEARAEALRLGTRYRHGSAMWLFPHSDDEYQPIMLSSALSDDWEVEKLEPKKMKLEPKKVKLEAWLRRLEGGGRSHELKFFSNDFDLKSHIGLFDKYEYIRAPWLDEPEEKPAAKLSKIPEGGDQSTGYFKAKELK